MDEQIKNELLNILREMRAGAPGAWQALVEQRSAYCLTVGIAMLAVFGAILIGSFVVAWRCRKDPILTDDGGPGKGIFTRCVPVLVALVVVLPIIGKVIEVLAEGVAPLGRVLEMLR